MTTKITVDAHAGWPVEVYALDSFTFSDGCHVTETLIATVLPGETMDFYATSSREIRAVEVSKTNMPEPVVKPLDFASVVRGIKAGKRFAREGWNGKGMYIAIQAGSTIPAAAARGGAALFRAHEGAAEISILPHIDMRAADGSIVVGWLASQTDLLAEDWTQV